MYLIHFLWLSLLISANLSLSTISHIPIHSSPILFNSHFTSSIYIHPFPPSFFTNLQFPPLSPKHITLQFLSLSLSLLSMGTKIISLTSIVLFAFFGFCLRGAYGDYGGWQTAHATFYGGGDASGTMGTLNSWNRHFFFTLHDLSCYKLCHVN